MRVNQNWCLLPDVGNRVITTETFMKRPFDKALENNLKERGLYLSMDTGPFL